MIVNKLRLIKMTLPRIDWRCSSGTKFKNPGNLQDPGGIRMMKTITATNRTLPRAFKWIAESITKLAERNVKGIHLKSSRSIS